MDKETPDKISTSSGILYKPQSWIRQGLCLVLVIVAGPALGWCMAQVMGGLSESAATFLFLPLPIILCLGYSLWVTRLKAIALDCIGKGIFWSLLRLIVKRTKPESIKDILPSREKLEEMAVRAQLAASSFSWAAIPVAILAGLVTACFQTHTTRPLQLGLVAMICLAWGHVLSQLGRRGYLPILEEGGG